jgi:hypothetical protein
VRAARRPSNSPGPSEDQDGNRLAASSYGALCAARERAGAAFTSISTGTAQARTRRTGPSSGGMALTKKLSGEQRKKGNLLLACGNNSGSVSTGSRVRQRRGTRGREYESRGGYVSYARPQSRLRIPRRGFSRRFEP